MAQDGRKGRSRRIFLIEDQPIVAEGLAVAIGKDGGLKVCGVARTAAEAIARIPDAAADAAIVDLGLPDAAGLDMLRDLHARFPKLPVLVFSVSDELQYAPRAIHAGARGYLMKGQSVKEICRAVRRIMEGKLSVSKRVRKALVEAVASGGSPAGEALDSLTDREMEVFEQLGRGRSTRQIAKLLHRSVKTIETHRAHVMSKLDVRDADELVSRATRWVELRDSPGTASTKPRRPRRIS